jgi:hypothetical protein
VPSAPNPHNSAAGRPADVSVIVVGGDASHGSGVEAVDALLPLLVVQLQLTLHAVVLYGRVCSSDDVKQVIKQVLYRALCTCGPLQLMRVVVEVIPPCIVVLQAALTLCAHAFVTDTFWSHLRCENMGGTWVR